MMVSGPGQNAAISLSLIHILLAKTGGIVQGMSGSPILQNGRLVGAVTHVLVNDPTRGYGIFAQTMLQQARAVEKTDDTAHTQAQNAK